MLHIQLKAPNAPHVKFSTLTVPIDRYPQGYEAGFAKGKDAGIEIGYTMGEAAANEMCQMQGTALLHEINTSLQDFGINAAADLHQIDNQIPYVYNKGFDDGFAKGVRDSESEWRDIIEEEKAAEDAALLNDINRAIENAAMNPTCCADTLADVPASVQKLYERAYSHGEDAGTAQAEAEKLEVNQVLTNFGAQTASTVRGMSEAVSTALENASNRYFSSGYSKGERDGREAGIQSESNRFWNMIQFNGTRTDYECAFKSWSMESFTPKYKVIPGNVQNGAHRLFQFCQNLKSVAAAYVDLSNVPADGLRELFSGCYALEKIEDIKIPANTNHYATFYNCAKLHTVEKIRCSASCSWDSAFVSCGELVNITFEGEIGQSGLDLQWSSKLSRASIESVITALSASANGKSVTLSKTAVDTAFETSSGSADGATSAAWLSLIGTKTNWTVSLV